MPCERTDSIDLKTKEKKKKKSLNANANALVSFATDKGRERQKAFGPYDGIGLDVLIKENLIAVGEDNLLAKYSFEGETVEVIGSITAEGSIYVRREHRTFKNPHGLSMDVKKRLNEDIKFTEGWSHVRYLRKGKWKSQGNDISDGQTLQRIRELISLDRVKALIPKWPKKVALKKKLLKKNKNAFPENEWNPRNTECVQFVPGTLVFVETKNKKETPKSILEESDLNDVAKTQIWVGRVWKLRHCRQKYELWDEHPSQGEEPAILIYLFGRTRKFIWAKPERCARFDDIEHFSRISERMLSHRPTKQIATLALEQAEKEMAEEFLSPWDTSDEEEDLNNNNNNNNNKRIIEDELTSAAAINHQSIKDSELKIDQLETTLREGLTPDWIVDGCLKVFELKKPTIDVPYVLGLLDPCSNSLTNPNIPAEVLYDKNTNGLLTRNVWRDKFILLNPPYEIQTQWRFIHRAINEIEWGHAKGIILVCRNSTDTNYFQRLLPFPRVMLRRNAVQFKDYTSSPVGFGIAVFCMVAPNNPDQREIYARFYDEFANAGEFSVPCDRAFASSKAFTELTERLHRKAAESQRDSFVACDNCDRWRELHFSQMQEAMKKKKWTCSFVFEDGCETPLSRREKRAFVVSSKDGDRILIAGKNEGSFVPGFIQESDVVEGEEEEDIDINNKDVQDEDNIKTSVATTQHEADCQCNWPPCIARRTHNDTVRERYGFGLSSLCELANNAFVPEAIQPVANELQAHLTQAERERLQAIEKNRAQFALLLGESETLQSKRERLLREADKVNEDARKNAEIFTKSLLIHKQQVDRYAVRSDSLKKALEDSEQQLKLALEKENEARKSAMHWQHKYKETEQGSKLLRDKFEEEVAASSRETVEKRIDAISAKREASTLWTRVSERVKKAKNIDAVYDQNENGMVIATPSPNFRNEKRKEEEEEEPSSPATNPSSPRTKLLFGSTTLTTTTTTTTATTTTKTRKENEAIGKEKKQRKTNKALATKMRNSKQTKPPLNKLNKKKNLKSATETNIASKRSIVRTKERQTIKLTQHSTTTKKKTASAKNQKLAGGGCSSCRYSKNGCSRCNEQKKLLFFARRA